MHNITGVETVEIKSLYDSIRSLLRPRHISSAPDARVAHILHVITGALVLALGSLILVRIVTRDFSLVVSFLAMWSAVILTMILSRKGLLNWSGAILVWALLAFVIYLMLIGDGFHDAATVAIPGILVIASLILSRRHFFVFTGLSLLSVCIIGFLDIHGQFGIAPTSSSGVVDLLVVLLVTGLTVRLLSATLVRNLEESRAAMREAQKNAAHVRESEKRYRALFEGANDAIFILDGIRFVECNTMAIKMYGCEQAADLIGHSPLEFSPAYQPDGVYSIEKVAAFSERARQGVPQRFYWKHEQKDGTAFDADVSLNAVEIGDRIYIQALVRNISKERAAENELRRNEERLRLVVEASNNGIWEWDILTNEVLWSDRVYEMFMFPAGGAAISLEIMKNLAHPDDRSRFIDALGRHLVNSLPYAIELRFRTGDGHYGHYLCRGKTMKDETGRGLRMFGSIEDITERKRAEEALRENEERLRMSLKEKAVLLKEIHHRVKNNMQVISSLLSLQANNVRDSNLAALFRESQHQMRSMALIHEKLYHNELLASIDFGKYIRELVESLSQAYNAKNVAVDLDVEDICLGVDTAIPCGLIINELVSNSLKHAFPNGNPGILCVGMHNIGREQYTLQVSDNGIGLPENFSLAASKSLGFQLIKALTEQLRGEINFKRNGGLSCSIAFQAKQ